MKIGVDYNAKQTNPSQVRANSTLKILGKTKNDNNNHGNHDPEFLIARTVMRYPSKRIRYQLNQLHKAIAKTFLHMSNEAIEWMLGGSKEMARGGFQNAADFKAFFRKNPNTISSSRLITALETITTAIGYRAIFASWVEKPYYPETIEQKKMSALIQNITKQMLVSSIGDIYTCRSDDRKNIKDPKAIANNYVRLILTFLMLQMLKIISLNNPKNASMTHYLEKKLIGDTIHGLVLR